MYMYLEYETLLNPGEGIIPTSEFIIVSFNQTLSCLHGLRESLTSRKTRKFTETAKCLVEQDKSSILHVSLNINDYYNSDHWYIHVVR